MAQCHCLVQRQRPNMQRQKVTNLLLFDKCAVKRNFVSMQAKYHVYHNYIIERIATHNVLVSSTSSLRRQCCTVERLDGRVTIDWFTQNKPRPRVPTFIGMPPRIPYTFISVNISVREPWVIGHMGHFPSCCGSVHNCTWLN